MSHENAVSTMILDGPTIANVPGSKPKRRPKSKPKAKRKTLPSKMVIDIRRNDIGRLLGLLRKNGFLYYVK